MSTAANRARTTIGRAGVADDTETRERIVREARMMFRERGYEGTVMSKLARAVGVTTPGLYWHFDSKASLCAEILERDYELFFVDLRARTVGNTPQEQLKAYVSAFVQLQIRDHDFDANFSYAQLRSALPPDAAEPIVRLEREMFGMLTGILRRGVAEGVFSAPHINVTAWSITHMCEYVFLWFRPDGELSAEEVGALYAHQAAKLVGPD